MHSKMMIFRSATYTSKTFYRAAGAMVVGLISSAAVISPASALVIGPQSVVQQQIKQDSPVVEVVVVRRGGVARGPRGNVVAGRTTVVRPGVRAGGWVRPGWYRWPAGGAIAAGAAIGFVAAASAAAYAGAPPAPGYCWYYTDVSRTQGFWDACP